MRKKIIRTGAAFIAAVMCLSACDNSAKTQTENTQSAEEPVVTTTSAETVPEEKITEAVLLSNPVAMTADGDVDMDAALAYETDFDKLKEQLDSMKTDPDHPVSQNSNPETIALYRWLKENYGKKVITAQMVGNNKYQENLAYYYYTDDLPAICGFDFIFKTTPLGDGADWTQMAIDWHTKSGGIVAFCWHWNVPCDVTKQGEGESYAFYSDKITNFSLENAITPGTEEYKVAVHDIDLIAHELQRLEAAGVPVLWRPLHEASGAWFWWGLTKESYEKELYQKLWYMIYDRLENYHKLTNLIWIWNGQSSYIPVHENTYDISGIDVYPNNEDHSSLENSYNSLSGYTAEGKMLALSECGYIPDPDELEKDLDTVKWLFYMPWNGEFVFKGTTLIGIPKINEEKMSLDFFKRAIKSDLFITWSELPEFEGTQHELPESIQLSQFDIMSQRKIDEKNSQ